MYEKRKQISRLVDGNFCEVDSFYLDTETGQYYVHVKEWNQQVRVFWSKDFDDLCGKVQRYYSLESMESIKGAISLEFGEKFLENMGLSPQVDIVKEDDLRDLEADIRDLDEGKYTIQQMSERRRVTIKYLRNYWPKSIEKMSEDDLDIFIEYGEKN